jgi:hypothetical protein
MKERRVGAAMGRVTKAIVITATAMIAAGMILSAIGLAFGGLNSINFGSRGFRISFETGPGGAREDASQGLYERFTDIDVDVDAYFIELREDDAYSVTIRNAYARELPVFDIEDGVLSVRDTARAREGGEHWLLRGNWLWALLNGHDDEGDIPTLRITYPKEARLGDVNIEAAAGKAEISGLEAESLSVDCSAGSLEIDETDVRDLSVTMSAGECKIEDVRAESAVVGMNAGSFSAKGFDCGALTGNFNMGDADVKGRLRGDVDISADMGSVRLDTILPESNYQVYLNVALGSATVGGRKISGGGIDSRFGGSDSAPYTIRVKAGMGNVEIDFAD